MGKLYDAAQVILSTIEERGLDVFRTRGAINMKTGFLITLVHEDDPDDPEKLAALRDAAKEVLDLDIRV
jgi:hypothetical protein